MARSISSAEARVPGPVERVAPYCGDEGAPLPIAEADRD
jgi:hypothetical protein